MSNPSNPLQQENVKTLGSDLWATPRDLVFLLQIEFPLTWDLAAGAETSIAGPLRYFGPGSDHGEDALSKSWSAYTTCGFLNPPFSLIDEFSAKAVVEARDGVTTVGLFPVKTETKWWHEHADRADEIRFLRGRLNYLDPETLKPSNPARFASAVIVWRPIWQWKSHTPNMTFWDWRKELKDGK